MIICLNEERILHNIVTLKEGPYRYNVWIQELKHTEESHIENSSEFSKQEEEENMSEGENTA